MTGLGMAAIGAAVGIVASTWVHILARKRDEKIWEVVEEDRIKINRIQTAIKWRRYGGLGWDEREAEAEELAGEIARRARP